jgi:hypothetical protein
MQTKQIEDLQRMPEPGQVLIEVSVPPADITDLGCGEPRPHAEIVANLTKFAAGQLGIIKRSPSNDRLTQIIVGTDSAVNPRGTLVDRLLVDRLAKLVLAEAKRLKYIGVTVRWLSYNAVTA